MSKLVFSFDDEKIYIAAVGESLGKINIKKSSSFNLIHESPNYKSIGNKKNIFEAKNLLDNFKFKNKKVDAVISFEEIITRIVEVPFLKNSDLDKYISNNISEYFTVNNDEFYFDYKIVSAKKKDGQDKLVVLMVAAPKDRINDIKEFITGIGAQIDKISIYPDALTRVFNNDNSYMVLDVNNSKSAITIVDKGEIFIYSVLNLEFDSEDGSKEALESLNYFLNFYAARHFGNKLEDIFIIGELAENKQLQDTLKCNIDGYCFYSIHNLPIEIAPEEVDSASEFIEVLGLFTTKKNRYDKLINFNKISHDAPVGKSSKIIGATAMLLLILTLSWVLYYSNIIQSTMKKYNTETLNKEISSLGIVQKQIEDAKIENNNLNDKARIIDSIKNDEIDYIHILDTLKIGLPSNVTVKTVSIKDKDSVDLSLNINNSTLDVAKAVIAINNMGIFENVDISDVKLDDTVNGATFALKLKK